MNTTQADSSLVDQVSKNMVKDGPVKLWVFYSHQKSCNYIFPGGQKAEFINGKYHTPDEGLALQLTQEIVVNRSPYFYIKKGEETIMSDDLDPTVKLKKQLRAEILQELYAEAIKIQMGASNGLGDYEQGKLKTQNTRDIEAVTAGADQTTGAKLAQIAQMVGIVPPTEISPVNPNLTQAGDKPTDADQNISIPPVTNLDKVPAVAPTTSQDKLAALKANLAEQAKL